MKKWVKFDENGRKSVKIGGKMAKIGVKSVKIGENR
jgi:hypothetical protein